MKLWAFFMAMYILLLSVVPCSDIHNDCINNSSQLQLTQTQNHNQHEDHTDHCSPFCMCSCCGSTLQCISISVIKIKNPFEVHISKEGIKYSLNAISNFYGSIWQPPKLVA
jgi:hypothetical protein